MKKGQKTEKLRKVELDDKKSGENKHLIADTLKTIKLNILYRNSISGNLSEKNIETLENFLKIISNSIKKSEMKFKESENPVINENFFKINNLLAVEKTKYSIQKNKKLYLEKLKFIKINYKGNIFDEKLRDQNLCIILDIFSNLSINDFFYLNTETITTILYFLVEEDTILNHFILKIANKLIFHKKFQKDLKEFIENIFVEIKYSKLEHNTRYNSFFEFILFYSTNFTLEDSSIFLFFEILSIKKFYKIEDKILKILINLYKKSAEKKKLLFKFYYLFDKSNISGKTIILNFLLQASIFSVVPDKIFFKKLSIIIKKTILERNFVGIGLILEFFCNKNFFVKVFNNKEYFLENCLLKVYEEIKKCKIDIEKIKLLEIFDKIFSLCPKISSKIFLRNSNKKSKSS